MTLTAHVSITVCSQPRPHKAVVAHLLHVVVCKGEGALKLGRAGANGRRKVAWNDLLKVPFAAHLLDPLANLCVREGIAKTREGWLC
jgi:hypothetical protein